MKRKKLKGFVLPSLYLVITISIFVGILLLGSSMILDSSDYDYGVGVIEDNVETVIEEEKEVDNIILSPIEQDTAEISIHYYNKDGSEEEQQNSLIYYEKTYLPNTGVLYTSDTEFNVMNVFPGKVVEILDDEFFGTCVVIEHSNSLRTYYYGLDKLNVKVNDELESKALIGVSKVNKIINNKNSFLFEVYHNSELLNPENFIGNKITEYK